MRKTIIIIVTLLAFISCKNEIKSDKLTITDSTKKIVIKLAVEKTIDSLIINDELENHLSYVFNMVDSFVGWNYPIVYALNFNKEKIFISVGKSYGIYGGQDSSFGNIGFFLYKNKIIQIQDFFDDSKFNNYYDASVLKMYNDTVLSPYAYKKGKEIQANWDLNLSIQLLYIKLLQTDSGMIRIEEKLGNGMYDFK